jgi:hypothetical protein
MFGTEILKKTAARLPAIVSAMAIWPEGVRPALSSVVVFVLSPQMEETAATKMPQYFSADNINILHG